MSSYRIHTCEDEGIVLVKKKILHSDAVVSIFTPQYGKIRVLAKGIQKITSKRISALQTGTLINVIFSERQSATRYLNSVSLISHLSSIKKSTEKLQNLYTILYLFDRLLPENQPDKAGYDLCKHLLVALAKKENSDFSITEAMNSIYVHLGYGECHSFEECVALGEDIMGKKMPLSII